MFRLKNIFERHQNLKKVSIPFHSIILGFIETCTCGKKKVKNVQLIFGTKSEQNICTNKKKLQLNRQIKFCWQNLIGCPFLNGAFFLSFCQFLNNSTFFSFLFKLKTDIICIKFQWNNNVQTESERAVIVRIRGMSIINKKNYYCLQISAKQINLVKFSNCQIEHIIKTTKKKKEYASKYAWGSKFTPSKRFAATHKLNTLNIRPMVLNNLFKWNSNVYWVISLFLLLLMSVVDCQFGTKRTFNNNRRKPREKEKKAAKLKYQRASINCTHLKQKICL